MNVSVFLPTLADLELARYLADWLPKTIIDSHVHVHRSSSQEMFNIQATRPGQTLNWFDFDQHRRIIDAFNISGVSYQAFVFGLPFRVGEKENNFYLREKSSDSKWIHPVACLTNKISLVDFSLPLGVKGVKTKIIARNKKNSQEIMDNFSEKVWNVLNSNDVFLIIHLP